MEAAKETKFGTKVAQGMRMMPELRIHAEKARDTTLDDENASQHVTSVVVTALCNQPEAFASDLGDDQSRYFFVNTVASKPDPPISCRLRRLSRRRIAQSILKLFDIMVSFYCLVLATVDGRLSALEHMLT